MDRREDTREEIRELEALKAAIDIRIERLRRRLITPEADIGRVDATGLRPYIQKWIDQGKSLVQLSDITGTSERLLKRILTGERELVKESTADQILIGLELPHVYNELYPPPSHYWEE